MKIIHQIAVENAPCNITEARELATREICQKAGMKKEDIAQAIWQIRNLRIRRREAKKTVSLNKQLQKSIEEKTKARFAYAIRQSLRVASGAWAGGAYYTFVFTNDMFSSLSVEVSTAWSSNGKWRGKDSIHRLRLRYSDTFGVVGGLFTIWDKKTQGMCVPCIWYEQSRGFDIKEKHGWLIGETHIEQSEKIQSSDDAKVFWELMQKKMQKKIQKKWGAEQLHLSKGWCMAGIRHFCELAGLDISKKYTVEQIKNASNGLSQYEKYICQL